jgi:hypothetical protein
MVRMVTSKTRHTIVHAAKRGAKNVKAVAGEAIGAAAKAATEVVLEKTNAALAAGRATLTRSTPAIKRAAEKTARQSVDKPQGGTRRRKRAAGRRAIVRRSKATNMSSGRRRKKTRRSTTR